MAKVFGPLFSLDARRSIGKALTYQRRPSGHAVMEPPRPGRTVLDNPTPPQAVIRSYYREAVEHWHALTESEKQEWRDWVAEEYK